MMKAVVLLTFVASMWATGHAHAALITFDELATNADGTVISDGYQGFDWSNWGVTSTTAGGYGPGTVSGLNVSYNRFGNAASFSAASVFTVNSLYATAAWNDGSQVTFSGWANGSVVEVRTVSPSATAPTLYALDWSGIDAFMVEVAGGTHHAGDNYVGDGPFVAIDNLTVNRGALAPIPEPGTCALMLAGLAAVGVATRRLTPA